MSSRAVDRPDIDGFLDLNKPRGITSMEVVRRVRRVVGLRRGVGHGGTLDPLADGVLPICLGQATRLMEFLVDGTKVYRAELRLGVTTDTYDAEGQVTGQADPSGVTLERVDAVLEGFMGTFDQMPPMYSALKHQGKRLYDLARAGVEVERQPRRVQVKRIEVLELEAPRLVIEVECGRGLYLRSLAHDIGQAIGCGAHLSALTRLRSGAFRLEDSVTLEDLERRGQDGTWEALLLPVDFPLQHMKAVQIGRSGYRLLMNGQPVPAGPQPSYITHLESCRAYSESGSFLGVVRWDRSQSSWRPFKMFKPGPPSAYAPT